jgi:hypothetical protein
VLIGEVEMREDRQAIRERARKLWEQAGKPEGKESEFWLEAERQLAEERIRHELKTPEGSADKSEVAVSRLKTMASNCRCADWARRPGASPTMRMTYMRNCGTLGHGS